MPEGIIATVDDGFATLDFVDPALRGPALTKLLEIGGAESIETLTRVGPRRQYRVPEGNAAEAGLVDGDARSARGLNADGTPDTGQGTGGTGTTTGSILRTDTGAAAALKAADPNTNVSPANAGDWHTPTAEYTSANAYVGDTTSAEERAMAPSPFTGVGTSVGGTDAADTPTHREVIDNVKAYETANPKGHARGAEARTAVKQPPVQGLNTSLKNQTGALASDPGGWAEQPEGPDTSQQPAGEHELTAGTAEGTTPPDTEDVVEYPEGAPSNDWRRDELDAYALKVKGLDTSDLPKKSAVLDAINGKK